MTDPTAPNRPFADAVVEYALAGWPCIIPVPPDTKHPPPVGYTGAEGRDTDPETLVQWVGERGHYSIALRMPDGVIGIDVDQYAKGEVVKNGAATLAEAVERWGPLPATWSSTARGEGPSRISFYRVPPGRYATKLGADVEVIQRHHRYAVVWPSPHAGAGSTYRWYDPAGLVVDAPPKPEELTELPASWVEGLAAGASAAAAASADQSSGEALFAQLEDDWRPECHEVTSARLMALAQLERSDAGSRHDTMTERTHHLVQLAAAGHTGVAAAIMAVREAWAELTAGEDRADELERAWVTSARKAVTTYGAVQVPRDPCLLMPGGLPTPLPPVAGENPEGLEVEIAPPPRWASVREILGSHAFDPNAGTDQALAEAVLERTYPALRYAYDSGGWLLRAPDRWELHRRLSPWAVAQVATLMPVGDPTAEKGSEPHTRHQRRMRLMSAGGARGVAGKMDDLVAGGVHPAAVALADLDADPEILWAGGVPWSLRSSVDEPVPATIDPATPHLHTAGVVPELRPTPLWDAFIAAVWPDADLREWATRVLAIAVTGYADRALPILLGETGRGKTQVVALMMSVLGSYAHAANPKLLSPTSNEHDTIVFDLKGRRLSFIDEAPSEAKSGQERLKQLTGGGELTGRKMNQDPITFAPSHTFVLTSNDEPVLTDPAVRSRARLIPCEGDPELVRTTRAAIGHLSSAAWRAEAPGVLARLICEAGRWLADPSTALVTAAPERIRYLAESIGAEQDPVAVWVTEETEYDETGTASRELYQAFTASCLRNNLRRDAIPSETKWGRALTRLGYGVRHTEHGKRRPLRLRSGGFMPGMETPSPSVDQTRQPTGQGTTPESALDTAGSAPTTPNGPETAPADGLADGFLTGLEPNPSGLFPQVNPSKSVGADGSDGLQEATSPHAHTRPRRNSDPGEPANPSVDPSSEPVHKPKAKKTTAASEKAAAKRAEQRAAALAEAAGPSYQLPATLTAAGALASCTTSEAAALLRGLDPLTLDVETTGYPIGHEHFAVRTVQLGCEAFAVVLDPHEADQADVVRRTVASATTLHAHSATADLLPLHELGLLEHGLDEAWSRMHDTVVLAKLADPKLTGSDPGLKQISAAMLGTAGLSKPADEARARLFKAGKWLTETKVTTPIEKAGWAQVDPTCETQLRYAASDVLDDAAIAARLPAAPPAVLERERTAQRMTARVAHHGLRIDGEHVEQLLAKHTAARAEAADLVRALAPPNAAIDNPGSGPQVAAALTALGAELPRTATGRPSVAEGVLDPFRRAEGPVGELATAVLTYREHDTALGTFLEPYRQLVVNGDGRARPTVYTLGADTGRMSCVRPNLQQVPREGGFRACITADPGHLLVSADFSGVEVRVAAALSGDRNLKRIIDSGEDLHWMVARQAWGPDATKAQRYIAKRGVFGRIYGGGVPTLARQMGVSEAVAQQVVDALDALLPELSEWSRQVREGVKGGRTQFPTYSGRVVHLDQAFPHKAPNYLIQGTARELLVDALLKWAGTPWGEAVLLPVHDELVVMVPEDQADDATRTLTEVMTSDLFGVPILAEASEPSFSWSDSA